MGTCSGRWDGVIPEDCGTEGKDRLSQRSDIMQKNKEESDSVELCEKDLKQVTGGLNEQQTTHPVNTERRENNTTVQTINSADNNQ